MALTRKSRDVATITAAARPVNIRDGATAAALSQVSNTRDQIAAWDLYQHTAELHYPVSYAGRNVGRFMFPVATVPAINLNSVPSVPDDDDRDDLYRAAEQAMFAFTSDSGDLSDLAEQYTKNMAVAGEAWMVAEGTDSSIPSWHVFSVREFGPIRAGGSDDSGIAYHRFPTGSSASTDPTFKPALVRRLWQKSPMLSEYADTSTFSVLDDLRDLNVLNRSLRARLVSRLTQAGFLFIPSSLSLAGPVGNPTGDGNAVEDPFANKLLNIVEKQMLSGASPAVPTIIRGDADAGEAIRFILTDRTIDRVELELRAEKRSNVARGMFLPPEVTEGLGSTTHWQSWSVNDSAYSHLLPYASNFADAVTRVYLWPVLRDWVQANPGRGYTEIDIRRHTVWPDGANVITRPNEAEDGRQLWDRFAISTQALRKRTGAAPTEAPEDDEYVRMLGAKNNNPYLATYGLPIHDQIDWDMVANVGQAEGRPGVGSIDEDHRPADSSDPAGAPGEGETQVERDQMAAKMFTLAANGHLLRARQKVGAKIRAKAEPRRTVHAALKSVPNEGVLTAVNLSEIDLTTGDVTTWFTDALSDLSDDLRSVSEGSKVDKFIDLLIDSEVHGDNFAIMDLAIRSVTLPAPD